MTFDLSETHPTDTSVVLTLRGRLDSNAAPQLELHLARLVEDNHVNVVVDLWGASYIDTHGLGVLVRALTSTRKRGGWLKLVFAGVPDLLGPPDLNSIFEVYPTVEAALAAAPGSG